MTRILSILILCAGMLLGGFSWSRVLSGISCAGPSGYAEAQESSAGQTKGIKDLPCFKCHIYERFIQEPARGVFSHALHVQFEYHCNQCHSFRGHRQMEMNTAVCTFCHDSVPQLKKP